MLLFSSLLALLNQIEVLNTTAAAPPLLAPVATAVQCGVSSGGSIIVLLATTVYLLLLLLLLRQPRSRLFSAQNIPKTKSMPNKRILTDDLKYWTITITIWISTDSLCVWLDWISKQLWRQKSQDNSVHTRPAAGKGQNNSRNLSSAIKCAV